MDFIELVEIFEKLEKTTKRLELTDDLAKLFARASPQEVKVLVYLCEGIVAPSFTGIELGIGDRLAMQAIKLVSGKSIEEIEGVYRRTGDLGVAAEEILRNRSQLTLARESLSVERVFDRLLKIASSSGEGSQDLKIKLVAELLSNSSSREAKVIVRLVTGNLRLGIAEATILDALSVVKAGDKSLRVDLERAFNLRSDLGLVAELFFSKGIEAVRGIKPCVFYPIMPALAERLSSGQQIFEKIGECAVEGKYDGLRLQVHKRFDEVVVFTRRLERVTDMFPDVVDAVRKQVSAREAIVEGEAVAFDEKKERFLPFQATIQRKRKYGVAEKAKEIPLKFFVFEVLYLDGLDCTVLNYLERRSLLEKIVLKGRVVELAEMVLAKSGKEIDSFFEKSVEKGLEGIIAKDLSQPYVAGARKFAWIKLKKSYSGQLSDTIDLVIVGFYYGKGKRTEFGFGGVLGAVFDEKNRVFKTLAKIGTGFSEEQMKEFSALLEEIKLEKKPVNVISLIEPDAWVKPKYVITVNADEITKSPVHTCGMSSVKEGSEGLALRFPRLVELRLDKAPEQATTEEEVLELYELQKMR